MAYKLNRPIHLVDYDPAWPLMYAAEKEQLLAVLGGKIIQIEHFGSTSVPGLSAKPVIDIAIGVEDFEKARSFIPSLESLGYTYEPFLEIDTPQRHFLWKGTPLLHTFHLSMEVPGGRSWTEHIMFRDYLRRHPDEVQRYQDLKRALAAQYVSDMQAYVNHKTNFVVACLEKAKAELESGNK